MALGAVVRLDDLLLHNIGVNLEVGQLKGLHQTVGLGHGPQRHGVRPGLLLGNGLEIIREDVAVDLDIRVCQKVDVVMGLLSGRWKR